jgi:hypothetical protein
VGLLLRREAGSLDRRRPQCRIRLLNPASIDAPERGELSPVVPVVCRPKSSRRSLMCGDRTPATSAELSFSTVSDGVLAGATTPYQPVPEMS